MKSLRKLRMTVNDLISALRQKDVFDISQVSYAIFETNGQISVLLKSEYRNSTAKDLNIYPADSGMPFAVVCDGKIIDDTVAESGLDRDKVKKLIISSKIPLEEIIIMTVTADGKAFIAKRGDDE